MSAKPLHVAYSPLTGTIYAGSAKADRKGVMVWGSNRTDVTAQAVGAVAEHIGAGNSITLSIEGVPTYEVVVLAIKPVEPQETPHVKS